MYGVGQSGATAFSLKSVLLFFFLIKCVCVLCEMEQQGNAVSRAKWLQHNLWSPCCRCSSHNCSIIAGRHLVFGHVLSTGQKTASALNKFQIPHLTEVIFPANAANDGQDVSTSPTG